ncbi:MAG: anhydro-N-acetylmuramic acid kinase [Phycisphaerae bacterium]|nr:anhydro-N-acetylmuramic acid kinase [Phycisphaerae bacterium]
MTRTTRRQRPATRCVFGMMSGTSCDGVDVARVHIRGRGLDMRITPAGHLHTPYPAALRRRALAIMCPAETTTQELAGLHVDLGRFFARAACEAIERLNGGRAPAMIGSHGQTICHLPNRQGGGTTIQLGDATVIAAAAGCPVVSDFRQADMALGGQGAPLVPWTDFVLFRHARRSRAAQNIGGIANVSYVPAGAGPEDVIAFDTGPGNMVIDALARIATDDRQSYDRNGAMAAKGHVLEAVLRRWLRHPYFRRKLPKSAGREDFGHEFVARELPRLRRASRRSEDWLATATAFTAHSIADAYRRFLPTANGRPRVDELIVTGGGAANMTLLAMLAKQLPGIRVATIDQYGIGIQEKEAVSFAMLAAAHVDGVPANLPQVTGASAPAILGKLAHPPIARKARRR